MLVSHTRAQFNPTLFLILFPANGPGKAVQMPKCLGPYFPHGRPKWSLWLLVVGQETHIYIHTRTHTSYTHTPRFSQTSANFYDSFIQVYQKVSQGEGCIMVVLCLSCTKHRSPPIHDYFILEVKTRGCLSSKYDLAQREVWSLLPGSNLCHIKQECFVQGGGCCHQNLAWGWPHVTFSGKG